MSRLARKKKSVASFVATKHAFWRAVDDIIDRLNARLATSLGGATYRRVADTCVDAVVAAWGDDTHLNWPYAVRKARSSSRSVFVGIELAGNIGALASIRVSKARTFTTLLFVERNRAVIALAGRTLPLIENALTAIAAYHQSRYIVIDNPLDDVIDLYRGLGYQVEKRRGRYPACHMKRSIP